ncbi:MULTISPECIES: TolC family outer membrane protein [Candidatus Accumulibacter]|jgi:outer membrane protein|uniref:TolC family outer membrane protein n=1 Tax=Candidatus Accumulibacter TaxID=327159 RepID=UPI001AC6C8F8|nr:TolC family outer membrane protein [Accumulibacter sp.]MBN8448997.1 TolC family outer membrane protein [Candidatus Accumulibacter necessarius]MBN8495924.1 TolC family outer membrane protein [Accumulibacter sp.]
MSLRFSAGRFSFVLAAVLSAVPACAADLVQVYREALSYDAQYAAARANAEAGREKLPQALAGLLPTIAATGNTFANDASFDTRINSLGINTNTSTRNRFNSNAYNVNLTQPLFRWQNFAQYGQSKLLVMQTEATFAQAGQDLILRVAQAYFDVLVAIENLRAVQANKTAIAQQLEQAKKNFEVGTATITDSYESQSRFDLATAQEIAADNELEVRRYALRVLIGRDPGELSRLKPKAVMEPPQPASMDPWVEAAERDSFVVQAQQAAAEAAGKAVEINRAGHYPTLDVVANYGQNNGPGQSGLGEIDTTTRQVGLQLNIPIFQGGAVNSRTREAIARRDAELATLAKEKRNSALGARQSYLGVVNGLAEIRALEAALVSSLSSLESNRLGYEVGVRINIDVLNAENQVYVTRRDLARARFNTLLAQLKLKAAVGSLAETDLEQINRLFEAP